MNLSGALGSALSHLTANEIESIARRAYVRNRRNQEQIEIFAKAITGVATSSINDLHLNGESWLIERTGKFGFSQLFDVGANIGDWSMLARVHHPKSKIHCFEIVPATFQRLKDNLSGLGNSFALNPFGLSDHDGQIEVRIAPENPYISSVYQFGGIHTKPLICNVRRGDAYALENGIAAVDFIKIDVEGAESQVIKGLESLINDGKVRLLQFEYNRGAIMSHFLLMDFYALLTKRGYRLGKLTPEGVIFRDYEYAHEDFNGPNYVACLAEDRELIEAISLT